jgi:hypothetical protein
MMNAPKPEDQRASSEKFSELATIGARNRMTSSGGKTGIRNAEALFQIID